MTQALTLSLTLLPALATAADYQLCFLEDGPESGKIEAAQAKALQAARMGHIGAMWTSGDFESAGPNLWASRVSRDFYLQSLR